MRHYRNVVETAAKYHTTLDVHEPIKDTGIRRTYPNMMTREGARGMEWNAWSEGNPPEHHVMLPFTRLLAGPMDYTPGIFDIMYERAKNSPYRKQWNMKDSKDCRINSTLAKQIANWVILYSPLQMAADMIENYEGHPAFQFSVILMLIATGRKLWRVNRGNLWLSYAGQERNTSWVQLRMRKPVKSLSRWIFWKG